MARDDQTKSNNSQAEFQHKAVENRRTEAYCAVFRSSASPGKPSAFGESRSFSPFDPRVLKLALGNDARHRESMMQDGPRPSDFGEHDPIPVEAMSSLPITEGEEEPE